LGGLYIYKVSADLITLGQLLTCELWRLQKDAFFSFGTQIPKLLQIVEKSKQELKLCGRKVQSSHLFLQSSEQKKVAKNFKNNFHN
jgi:hypothetical protein